MIFFENENFAARARGKIRRIFKNELIKIKTIESNVPIFENRKRVKITPSYYTLLEYH